MKTPIGVVLEIGQKWREVDPRTDRVVIVKEWDDVRERVRIGTKLNPGRWAKLKRFNGKRCGYAPV